MNKILLALSLSLITLGTTACSDKGDTTFEVTHSSGTYDALIHPADYMQPGLVYDPATPHLTIAIQSPELHSSGEGIFVQPSLSGFTGEGSYKMGDYLQAEKKGMTLMIYTYENGKASEPCVASNTAGSTDSGAIDIKDIGNDELELTLNATLKACNGGTQTVSATTIITNPVI